MKNLVAASLVFLAFPSFLAKPHSMNADSFYKDETIHKMTDSIITPLLNTQTRIIEYSSHLNIPSLKGQADVLKLTVDENFNVLDERNESVGHYVDVYKKEIKGNVLPCLSINKRETADKYIEYVEKTAYIRDAYIYSDSINVLKKLSENKKIKNNYFVFDISQYDLESEETVANLIQVGNSLGVDIFALDSHHLNFDRTVDSFALMQKALWGKAGDSPHYIHRTIASGASGCLFSSLADYRSALSKYDEPGSSKTQYIAAHRGAVNGDVNENSLDSVARAASLNADYVEIDLQITKDRKIMVCHNNRLHFTTSCTNLATFTDKTAEEVLQYDLNDNHVTKKKKVPFLREIFSENKDNDLRFILEFKFDGAQKTLDWDVAKYVNEIVEEHQMQDRVLGITFFTSYYRSIKTHMPYMPTLYLGLKGLDPEYRDLNELDGLLQYLKKHGTGIDYEYVSFTQDHYRDYISRGYLPSSWTFTDVKNLKMDINIATSDATDAQATLVRDIPVGKHLSLDKAKIVETRETEVELYNGAKETKALELKILEGDKNADKYLTAVYYYHDSANGYGLYSDAFTINVTDNGATSTNIHESEYTNGKEAFKTTYKTIGELKDEVPSNTEKQSPKWLTVVMIAGSSIAALAIVITIPLLIIKSRKAKKN